MKWVVLLTFLLCIPIVVQWIRSNPAQTPWLSAVLGASIFIYVPWHLSVSPWPWPLWPGYVRGIQVTALDALALSIIIAYRGGRYRLPFQWQMLFYFVAVLIAVVLCPVPIASSFYLWQLLRVYVVFRAVATLAQHDRHWVYILMGLMGGVAYQALEAGWARAHGMAQSGGTLGHQNLLGMLTNLVLMPSVAMVLGGIRAKWASLGVLAGGIALVFTASRASIGIGAIGIALIIVLSLFRKPSSRKISMASAAVLVLGLMTPLALKSLSNRFAGTAISFSIDTEEVRLKMEQGARMMIADYPFGVGPNYFVVAANRGHYWERAGFSMTNGNMSAHVHNSYLLARAETGFIGLTAICLLFLSVMIYCLVVSFRYRQNARGDVLLGLGVSVVAFALHNTVEWAIVSENAQYLLAVLFGLIAGIGRNLKVSVGRVASPRSRKVNEDRPEAHHAIL